MRWNYALIVRLFCFTITASIVILLWVLYSESWKGMVPIQAIITEIDISSVGDCDLWDGKKDNDAVFHYNYTFNNEVYTGFYEICETNDGLELHLDHHPVGSEVKIFIRPNRPTISEISKGGFSNKVALGFGVVFSLVLLLWILYFTCAFDEVTKELKEMFAEEVGANVKVGISQIT